MILKCPFCGKILKETEEYKTEGKIYCTSCQRDVEPEIYSE